MAFQEGFQPNGGFIPPQSTGGNGGGGAGGGVMVVTINTIDNRDTLSASYDELKSALTSGKIVACYKQQIESDFEVYDSGTLIGIAYVPEDDPDFPYSAGFPNHTFIASTPTEPMSHAIE